MTDFNTKLVHGIPVGDNQTGAVVPPIYQSTTFAYPQADAKVRWDYTRSGNPTREYLEKEIAYLEDGDAGFAFSSGLATISTVFSIFDRDDHIIIGDSVYGGTYRLLNDYFTKHGLSFTTVDTRDLDAIKAAIQPNTRAIYFETLSNPLLKVTSVKKVSALAKEHGLLTIVDNTFLTPYLQQPLNLGADIVIHSATKYLGGHSDVLAGLVVTKAPALSQQVGYLQNALGPTLAPEAANLVRRGIETLSLRMDREQQNALAIAEHLEASPLVSSVHYPGLKQDPNYQIAQEELNGAGGVLSFELADNGDADRFVNHLKLFTLAVSLGSVASLAELPWTMTHAELPVAARKASGLSPQLIRLAIGVESVRDLIEDLDQALGQVA